MSAKIPTTRGFVIQNLLRCFEEEGGDGHAACLAVGLPPPASLDAGDVLLAELYHALFDHMTAQIGDPCFAARVGRTAARQGVPALVKARRASRTVGEFLVRCQIIFKSTQENGWYVTQCDGAHATLEIRRLPSLKVDISKVETMNAAAWITIFRDAVGEAALTDLTASLPEPKAMPDDILPRRQCVRSKDGRMKLFFPAAWLVADMKSGWFVEGTVLSEASSGSMTNLGIEPIRNIVFNAISCGDADLGTVASRLAMSKRKLQRLMSTHDTSFSKLLREERLRHSSKLLRTTRQTIREIAEACGFSSSQALSKSFRAAFGMSPSEYRRTSNSDDPGSDVLQK